MPRTSPLRQLNVANVLEVLAGGRAVSRSEIAERTGLSRLTVSAIVHDLEERALVVSHEGSRRRGRAGRAPALFTTERPPRVAVGIDLGHHHVRVMLTNEEGALLASRDMVGNVDMRPSKTLDVAAALTLELLTEAGPLDLLVGAAAGVPAPIDPVTGEVDDCFLPGWSGIVPARELSERLEIAVEVDNDANLGALAQVTFGDARGERNIVYLKIAGGIGAGIVIGGEIYRGGAGLAGELGHIRYADGAACRCGNRGCLEAAVSWQRLAELVQPDDPRGRLSPQDLYRLLHEGRSAATPVLAEVGHTIGRVMASATTVLNPSSVLLGGSTALASDDLVTALRDSLHRYASHAAASRLVVRRTSLGKRAEVLGAVALGLRSHARGAATRWRPPKPTGWAGHSSNTASGA